MNKQKLLEETFLPINLMRQPTRTFISQTLKTTFGKNTNGSKDTEQNQDDFNDRSLTSSLHQNLEEVPDQLSSGQNRQREMNMDDRDKAGDPDSNPEIDDDDDESMISSTKVMPTSIPNVKSVSIIQ